VDTLLQLRQRFPVATDLARLGQQLRKTHPSQEAIWLLQQLEMYWDALRLQAFRDPLPLWFEAQALQMGSRWPLAERRAVQIQQRFAAGRVVEVGAGIGGDSLELARLHPLRTSEKDPTRFRCLVHNLENLEGVEVHAGDGLELVSGAACLYADPARRNAHGRQWHNLDPDPSRLWELSLPTCLKLSPGLDESTLPPGCDLDYVSHQGVCKEAVVWLPGARQVCAWLYRDGHWLSAPRCSPPPLGRLEPGMWIHEPDPAAIRAQAWEPRGGWRIDESLALLASEPGLRSPWAQSFEVVAIGDSDLKSLVKLQTLYDFQPLEIKKRGFDVEPEQLRKKLPKGKSGGAGVIWLTRRAGRHCALICRRLDHR
jgi:hypothetical protein